MRFELTTLTLAKKSFINMRLLVDSNHSAGGKMANIRRLKSGNWNVQVRIAGKPARSQTFHTQKEARAWATKQESMINFRHPTLEEAGLQYCGSILAEKPSRNLTELQFKRIGKRSEFAKPLDKVSLQDVNAYKQKRLIEVSGTTVRDDLMVIRRVYRWYIAEWFAKSGEVLSNPCDRLVLPKARRAPDHRGGRGNSGQSLRWIA